MWLFAVRTGLEAFLAHEVVHDLALERVHGLEIDLLASLSRLVNGIEGQITQMLALALKITVNIENQMRTVAGLLLDGEPGQLLQRVHDFAIAADQLLDVFAIVGDDLHRGAVITHAQLDVSVIIGDVKQTLEVVGGDISLLIELLDRLRFFLSHMNSFMPLCVPLCHFWLTSVLAEPMQMHPLAAWLPCVSRIAVSQCCVCFGVSRETPKHQSTRSR